MNIVLLGLPGAGKGTLGQKLSEVIGAEHISSGDLLRAEVRSGTLIGRAISSTIAEGKRVDDALITQMVLSKLTALNGKPFILDGYPQTESQVQALKEWGETKFIHLTVDEDTALSRMSQRISCASCNAIFSISQAFSMCTTCGGPLEKRSSDEPEKARRRLNGYAIPISLEDAPQINGLNSPEQVYKESLTCLNLTIPKAQH